MGNPMTPAQITRGICMRRYAWGKRVQQISDESGVPAKTVTAVIMGAPFSDAVRARLEGYLRTPAGPAALRQDNDRGANPDGRRFRILRRVLKTRAIAVQFKEPICARDRLKSMTQGELRSYFYNLSDRVKRRILTTDPTIARHWKFADDMEPWEFIERLDQLRARRKVRNAARLALGEAEEKIRRPAIVSVV